MFAVPAILVNVSFQAFATTPHYVAGKRVTGKVNMMLTNVRQGGSRTAKGYEPLCTAFDDAWTEVVLGGARTADRMDGRALTCVFAMGTLTKAMEQGLMIPSPGEDREWVVQNMDGFKRAADEGNAAVGDMLVELKARPEFMDLFKD
jgi:hypothetical protein